MNKIIEKKEIFVDDLDVYFQDKKYKGELIGLYEPDEFDMEIVIQNYANSKYKFIIYFENAFITMPLYKNFTIMTDFVKFYNSSSVFAIYQEEEYYTFDLKLFDTIYFTQ